MFLAFNISDIIRVPFGYLLDWLYQFTSNYGVALILFALLVKLILLPVSAKSKKGMMQMSRMAPLVQAIQSKYADDPQRANLEVSKVYKEEGVSMFGGCLWSLIPMLLIFPLFYVIRQPLEYMLHFTSEEAAQIVTVIKGAAPQFFSSNAYYDQVAAAPHLGEFAAQIKEAIPALAGSNIPSLNFQFLGVNLGQIPSFKFWAWETYDWNTIGAFLLPVLSAASQLGTMFVSQKLTASVSTDKDGNVDDAAAKSAAKTNKVMMWTMPLFSLWIGFSYPCSLSLYWLCQGLFGLAQDVALTKHYRKIYDAEDSIKRRIAAERAAIEAEKERVRAQRRAENPDGIVTNTSKKKLQKQQTQKEQEIAAARRAGSPEDENAPLSGDPERPYCKGRAYRADRYARPGGSDEE